MEDKQIRAFLNACQKAKRIFDLMPKLPSGMVPRHIFVIEAIAQLSEKSDNIKVSDISELMKVTKPGITKIISELEQMGAVQKIQHATDKRIYLLSLTDLGKQYEQFYVRGYHQWLASHMDDISSDDLQTTIRTIETIYQIMENLEIQDYQRLWEEKNND